ncbi:MAG: HAD family hydrolase [bacterium]
MEKTLLLFDVDGTLLISGGAGNRSLNRALQQRYGISEAMKSIIPDGKTDPAIIREIFKNNLHREPCSKEISDICRLYVKYLQEEIMISAGYRLLPGIFPLLEKADQTSGIFLGLLTGNLKRGAEIKLERSRLNRYFPFGGFGSDSEDRHKIARLAIFRGRKYAGQRIPLNRVFIIGDTLHDIRCARSAGAKVLAVATGSTPLEELASHQPDYVMEDLSDREQFWRIITS